MEEGDVWPTFLPQLCRSHTLSLCNMLPPVAQDFSKSKMAFPDADDVNVPRHMCVNYLLPIHYSHAS